MIHPPTNQTLFFPQPPLNPHGLTDVASPRCQQANRTRWRQNIPPPQTIRRPHALILVLVREIHFARGNVTAKHAALEDLVNGLGLIGGYCECVWVEREYSQQCRMSEISASASSGTREAGMKEKRGRNRERQRMTHNRNRRRRKKEKKRFEKRKIITNPHARPERPGKKKTPQTAGRRRRGSWRWFGSPRSRWCGSGGRWCSLGRG
jgi:hypothetical protein